MDRKTLTALGIFVGLGLIALLTWRSPEQGERVTAKPRPLPHLTTDDLQTVTMASKGQSVSLVRNDKTWRVTKPVDYPADKYASETLQKKLLDLEFGDLISERQDRQDEFEVNAQKGIHVQVAHHGKIVADFYLGKTLSGFTMFRVEGQKKIWQAVGSLRSTFDKKLKNWRDRRIFSFKDQDVRGLEFTTAAGTARVGRKDAKSPWTLINAPTEIPKLDANALRHALSTLSSLSTFDFADAMTPTKAGLDHPRATIKAILNGATTYGLEIGKELKDHTYARVVGKKQIFSVPKGSVQAFALRPIDLKDKAVLAFDPAKVTVLTLEKRAGQTLESVVLRRDDKNPKAWFGSALGVKLAKNVPGKKVSNTTKLEAALKTLSNLQANHFTRTPLSQLGLNPGAWTVTIELADGKQLRLTVGSILEKQSRAVRTMGNPNVFMVRDYVTKQFLLEPKNYL